MVIADEGSGKKKSGEIWREEECVTVDEKAEKGEGVGELLGPNGKRGSGLPPREGWWWCVAYRNSQGATASLAA
jgi:hypothetical protein